MKNLLLLSIVVLSTLGSLSAKKETPPGCVRINDSLFVDRTEIRNLDYREYIYWTSKFKGADSEEYQACLPDSTVWRDNYKLPYNDMYFRHPAYSEYPVVGVSYQQALDYCQWRTERVNEMIYLRDNKLSFETMGQNKDFPIVYVYRLPTEEEWELIATFDYSKKTKKKLKKKRNLGLKKFNLMSTEFNERPEDINTDITAPAQSYWPNSLGVYNMIGNVAEMTSQEGLAKGASWQSTIEEASPENDFEYTQPECWLGFRCICDKV